jgi:hypothetical protein
MKSIAIPTLHNEKYEGQTDSIPNPLRFRQALGCRSRPFSVCQIEIHKRIR